jgi:crossover junction endodeoxyribonuclease RuvC
MSRRIRGCGIRYHQIVDYDVLGEGKKGGAALKAHRALDLIPETFTADTQRSACLFPLRGRCSQHHIDDAMRFAEVYFEEVRRHLGTDAAHVYGGLLGTLVAWCEEKRIPYAGVPVQTIKKSWTGKGNAKKALMIAEANARGFSTEDENEADAIALAHHIKGTKNL